MHQSVFRPIYIFNNDVYFLDFRAQKFPLIFFNLNPFQLRKALHFGALNYEKQHKECTCKFLGRSVVFSAFYADFCFCSKSVIITTLMKMRSTLKAPYSITKCVLAIIYSNLFSHCKVDQKKTVTISQMFNHVQLHVHWMHLLNNRICMYTYSINTTLL